MNYQNNEQNRDEQGSTLNNENQQPINEQADDMMQDNMEQRDDDMLDGDEPMAGETENIGLGEDEMDTDDETDDMMDDEDMSDLGEDDLDDMDDERRDSTII